MRNVIVTTSWDDGHPQDAEVAELLERYNLPGTFYIPLDNGVEGKPVMTKESVKQLSKCFEIGGHTFRHRHLTNMPSNVVRQEILEGKKALEEIIAKPVNTFCYPGGKYNQDTIRQVRESGFEGARTVERFRYGFDFNRYEIPTTVHASRHLAVDNIRALILSRNWSELRRYVLVLRMETDFAILAREYFDIVYEKGGVFHIWGHSWEIEEHGLWERLKGVFEHISNRADVSYLVNGQVLKYIPDAK